MEFLLPLLGGALGAAFINGAIAVYKLKRDKNDEHSQWLRNQKLTSYVEYLDTCRAIDNFAKTAWRKEKTDRYLELSTLVDAVQVTTARLLAPKSVTEAMDVMLEAVLRLGRLSATQGHPPTHEEFQKLWKDYGDARAHVGVCLRSDLGVKGNMSAAIRFRSWKN
jgi:hypothetical protein